MNLEEIGKRLSSGYTEPGKARECLRPLREFSVEEINVILDGAVERWKWIPRHALAKRLQYHGDETAPKPKPQPKKKRGRPRKKVVEPDPVPPLRTPSVDLTEYRTYDREESGE